MPMGAEFDLEKWFSRLSVRLDAIREGNQRAILFARSISALSPEHASTAFSWVLHNAFNQKDISSRLASEAAMFAILRNYWPSPHRVETYDAAVAAGERLCTLFLFDFNLLSEEAEEEENLPLPPYNASRPLTLGERRSIASKPSRKLIELATRDPHPMVIAKLLDNPKLTEDDVVYIAARRPVPVAVLVEVALHGRWRQRKRVARTLIKNPALPPLHALTLLFGIDLKTVTEIAKDRRYNDLVREAAMELLRVFQMKKGNFLS